MEIGITANIVHFRSVVYTFDLTIELIQFLSTTSKVNNPEFALSNYKKAYMCACVSCREY